MNLFAINSAQWCCNIYNTVQSNFKVKKQFMLILIFLFLGSFLTFGQSFSGSAGAIDDDNCPVTNDFTASVSGIGVLGATNYLNKLTVNMTHPYIGDIEITLKAPDGTSVLLINQRGGSGNNLSNTRFQENAPFSITSGSAPFNGIFLPEGNFSDFNGINADGTWTLEVCDDGNNDLGTLDSWSISFDSEAPSCGNPINPSPSCNALNVAVVLDESGSIDSATEAQVEAATLALANALKDTGAEMAFVEFASSADIPTYGGLTNWNPVNQALIDGLNNGSTGLVAQYGNRSNTTSQYTNWEDALNKVLDLNAIQVADIVLFMTDGNPTAFIRDSDGAIRTSQSASASLNNALDEACEVKQMGSHMFMLGVGNGITASNLEAISGPIVDDGPANPTLTVLSADYGLITAGDLTQCFLDIAQSGCNNDLSLEKSVYAGHNNGASCDGLKTIPNPNNSEVTYCFTISNDGDQTISNLDFSDSDINIDENDLTPAWQTSLASGAEVTYYYETTFSGGQTFPFLNTADVTGETPTGDPLSDSSSAEVTEPLCNPGADCNQLADVPLESCTVSIPSNYDAGDADGELADIFSNIETCGTAGIRHEDSNPGDVCNGTTITRTYYLTDDGQDVQGVTCTRDFVFTVPSLTINCPTNVALPSCSTEQDIIDAYNLWVSEITVSGGCNTISNIADIPALPSYDCDAGVLLDFTLEASDDCGTVSCETRFLVDVPETLIVSCPQDVILPACSTEQEILVAYNNWVGEFLAEGDCNLTSNIADIPALPAYDCEALVYIDFTFVASNDCGTVSCNSRFIVDNEEILQVECPQDVNLPACSTEQEILIAYNDWVGDFLAEGDCSLTSNIADIPALPPYDCDAGVLLDFTLEASNDCGTVSCSSSFVVQDGPDLEVSCPTNVTLPSCSSEQDIIDAYNLWVSEITVSGGCNTTSNIADIPELPAYVCGAGIFMAFTLEASDDCGTTSCETRFLVDFPEDLIAVCPPDVILPACSTEEEIQTAYNNWAGGDFLAEGDCNMTSNIADIPALPPYDCDAGVNLQFTLTAVNACGTASCSTSFVVLDEPDLEVSCPTGVNLDPSSTEQEIQDAYDAWKLGFTMSGGCNASDNLDTFPSLPAFDCGTAVNLNFTYIATDSCNPNGVSCSSTFIVPGVTNLTVDCPIGVNLDSCTNEADILSAYNLWVAGFGVNNGDNPSSNIGDIPALPAYVCGAAVDLSFTLTAIDACNPNGVSCNSTFKVQAADALSLSPKPTDVTTGACVNPEDEFAGWILALENMSASGGCNASVNYSVDLNTLSVDGYCNTSGQVVSVDITAKDDCGETTPVTATFTVPAYSNDLQLLGDCPTANEVDGCSTNADIALAFDGWKTAMLANFSATGGCNAEVEYSTDVSNLQAPAQCGTVDQVISVDVKAIDDCGETSVTTCSFTVKAFESTLELTEVTPESYPSCDYASQDELDSAFLAFLNKFGFTGGCDATGQLASAYSAPDLCAGGTVNVTYNVTDLCENGSETASFTITPSAALEVSCPTGVSLNSSSTEQEIQDAYDAWKLGFTMNGGCNATDNLDTFPSLPDFNCGTAVDLDFTYTAIDRCHPNGVSCNSTFSVPGITGLTVDCPTAVNLDSCTSESDILLAYNAWVDGFGVNNGDNPTSNIGDIPMLPAYECGAAVDLSFTLTAIDACNPNGVSCTSTFKIEAAVELALLGDCPINNEVDGCSTNDEISAAFEIWKAEVLSNFSATGGCNAEVEYSTDVLALQAPTQCGSTDQVVTVDINASDDCGKTVAVPCSFTVKAFESTLEVTDVIDESYNSCDFASQGDLDLAFQAFLDKFGFTGGCDALGQLASAYGSPDLCAGGTVNVTYNVTDLCENDSEVASFTITPSVTLEVSCPTEVNLGSSLTQQEIQDAYDAWKLGFTVSGGCNATDNLNTFPSLPNYSCDTSINLSFEYIATDRCHPNGVSCSSTFSIEGREPVDAGENGTLTICENGTVTAEELFEALEGNPNEGGTWSPEPGGADIYTYTVQGLDPCPDDIATVTVEELILDIIASEPVCDDVYGTYVVNIQVSEGTVTSTMGTPVDNGGGSWTITNIPIDNDIVVTTTTTVSNDIECTNSVNVISPDCICIELDLEYSDVTCFGLNDGTITVDFVTEGATVTVNGEEYNPDMLYVPGTYTIVATIEGNNDPDCTTSEVVTIIEPALVDVQVSSTDATCYGANDGTITIESLSEGAYYTIKLNGIGPDLSDQDFFAPGTYVVEARLIDGFNSRLASNSKGVERSQNPCVDGKLVVIGEPDLLMCRFGKSFRGNEIRCNDRTNNYLTVNHAGGVGPYTYSWSMNKSGYSGFWQIQSGSEEQTMTYIPGLGSVIFSVEITDANGCTTTCELELKSTCTKADYYNSLLRVSEFDFDMYPNPTKGNLTILPNRITVDYAVVELFDLMGTRVLNQTFNGVQKKKININLSGLVNQVYYLKVTTKDGTKIKKVVLDK